MSKVIDFNLVECDEILFENTSLLSYGYGVVSQLPMKDRELSIQAKGIYAYLVSCAGNDRQTYPNKETMCYDLGIKKVDTLTKYIRQLQSKGYIKIVKTKRGNLKYKNVYIIAADTRTIEIWKNEFNNGKEIENAEIVTQTNGKITYQEIEKDTKVDENKEAPTFAEVEAEENLENLIDNDSIPQIKEKYTKNLREIKNNILTDETDVDIREIAYDLCMKEVPDFEKFDDIRKDFYIGIKIRKILNSNVIKE